MPNLRNNAHDFETNRDRDAFGELLNRTPKIGYAKGQLWRIEFVPEPMEYECDNHECHSERADVRVVWNYGEYNGFGSDEYCLSCLREQCRDWVEKQLDEITVQFRDYQAENY
jgi:hypothetical protein